MRFFSRIIALACLLCATPAFATIPTSSSSVTAGGNGATTVFSFPFVAAAASDIQVSYVSPGGTATALLPSQFSVYTNPPASGAIWGVGGTVTYPLSGSPIPAGSTLTIFRILPLIQTISLSNQSGFYPQLVEQGLDTLAMQIQQVNQSVLAGGGGGASGVSSFNGRSGVVTLNSADVTGTGALNTALPSASTSQLYGGTAASGAARSITLGTNLSMSGSTLNATGGTGGGITAPATTTVGNLPQYSNTSGTALSVGLPVGTTGVSTVVKTDTGGLVDPTILPQATTGAFGAIKPDGSTITVSAGVISTAAGGGNVNGPASSTANHFALFNNTSGTLLKDGTTVAVKALLNDTISIGDYGAVCNGSTDDTTAIQNAWNAAATAHKNLKVSGVGASCKFSSITMPTPTQTSAGVTPPYASLLVGDGPQSVNLVSTVTGTSCAITINPGTFAAFEPTGVLGGFTLTQTAGSLPSAGGYGLCLTGATKLDLDNLFVLGFTHAIHALDSIEINVRNSSFNRNDNHIWANIGSSSHPNAWNIEGNTFAASRQYAIFMYNPAQINIHGNTFEGSGYDLVTTPITVYSYGNPIDGSTGMVITGNYFELSQGNEIGLQQLVSGTPGSHVIENNLFVRNSNNLASIITLYNGGTNLTSLKLDGNSFLDVSPFTPGAGYPYINESYPSSTNYQVFCWSNVYTNASEMPARCQTPAANSVYGLDANGNYAGFSTGGYLPLLGGTLSGTLTGSNAGTWGSGGINATNIGATTAATGSFTTLAASGTSHFTGAIGFDAGGSAVFQNTVPIYMNNAGNTVNYNIANVDGSNIFNIGSASIPMKMKFTTLTTPFGAGCLQSSAGGVITSVACSGTGTVTSVGGTGSVAGLTLSGTVTSSGSLTLGGSLSSSAVGAAENTYLGYTPANGASYLALGGGTVTGVANFNNAVGINGAGSVVFQNTVPIYMNNAGNTVNYSVMSVDGTNKLQLGSASIPLNLNLSALSVGGTAAVSCSGSPTGSFAVTNGIVTHC